MATCWMELYLREVCLRRVAYMEGGHHELTTKSAYEVCLKLQFDRYLLLFCDEMVLRNADPLNSTYYEW